MPSGSTKIWERIQKVSTKLKVSKSLLLTELLIQLLRPTSKKRVARDDIQFLSCLVK